MISCCHVRIDRAGKTILRDIHLTAKEGEILALLGPNGAGKSTLLQAISGNLKTTEGQITIAGQSVTAWHPRALAGIRSVLPQQPSISGRMTVNDLVQLSLGPWVKGSHSARAAEAMACVGISELSWNCITRLSGGQLRLVHLARVLAQIGAPRDAAGKIVLLDEPLAGLDPARQMEMLSVLRKLSRSGATVVIVLHEINHALNCADRVALLHRGQLAALGRPLDVLTAEMLNKTYGVAGEVISLGQGTFFCPFHQNEALLKSDA